MVYQGKVISLGAVGLQMGFVQHESWWNAIKNLPRDVQGDVLTAIIEYGLSGETIGQLKPITKALPVIYALIIRCVSFGRWAVGLAWRITKPKPNHNQTITKPKPNHNQTIT